MLLKRSSQEILRDAAISIAENSPITNFTAGGIARSIIEAIAPEIGSTGDTERVSLYDFAQQVLDEGFISKASEETLPLIGGLFSYPWRNEQVRQADGTLVESPIDIEMYRYELTQVVPSMATANYAALRLELLKIQGVEDVIGKEYTHGTGSFSFILVSQYGFDEEEMVKEMYAAMDKVKSFGVRPNIIVPEKIPVDVTLQVSFNEATTESQKQTIRFETQNKIIAFFGAFIRGQGFVYNDFIQEVMNSNDKIVDFEITKFYLNNEPVLLTNQSILDDERIIPQTIQVL